MKSLLDSALSALRGYIEKNHAGNVASAARELDISVPTLHTWMKGTRIPSFSKMAPLLEKIGAYIVSPDERHGTAREVCFVEAKTVPAGEHLVAPDMEEYLVVNKSTVTFRRAFKSVPIVAITHIWPIRTGVPFLLRLTLQRRSSTAGMARMRPHMEMGT